MLYGHWEEELGQLWASRLRGSGCWGCHSSLGQVIAWKVEIQINGGVLGEHGTGDARLIALQSQRVEVWMV